MKLPELGDLLILPRNYAPYMYATENGANSYMRVIKSGTPMIVLEVAKDGKHVRVLTSRDIGWISSVFFERIETDEGG